MNNFYKQAFRILLFLAFGLFLLYLIYLQQSKAFVAECALKGIPEQDCHLSDKLFEDFKTVNYWWILVVMMMFSLSNLSRAIRWNMLMEPLGYKPRLANSFHALMVGYFANMALPRIGEVARATSLAKYEKISTRRVLGTVFTDRLLDLVCMGFFVILTMFFERQTLVKFLTENIEKKLEQGDSITVFFVILTIMFFSVLLLAYLLKARIKNSKLYSKFGTFISGFSEGIKSIKYIKRPWAFLGHTIFIWVMFYLMTYTCFFAFGPTSHLNMSQAMLISVLGTLGVILPSPGGMGTYHALIIIGLGFYNIAQSDAFSFANIMFFAVQVAYCTIMGIIALVSLPLLNHQHVEMDHLMDDVIPDEDAIVGNE